LHNRAKACKVELSKAAQRVSEPGCRWSGERLPSGEQRLTCTTHAEQSATCTTRSECDTVASAQGREAKRTQTSDCGSDGFHASGHQSSATRWEAGWERATSEFPAARSAGHSQTSSDWVALVRRTSHVSVGAFAAGTSSVKHPPGGVELSVSEPHWQVIPGRPLAHQGGQFAVPRTVPETGPRGTAGGLKTLTQYRSRKGPGESRKGVPQSPSRDRSPVRERGPCCKSQGGYHVTGSAG
jgi:hypothetical protein